MRKITRNEQLSDRLDTSETNAIEFFRSRGIGLDACDCFVCGTEAERSASGTRPLNHNLAAFVQTRTAGEHVVAMFTALGSTAWLDYRPSEPNWVQVKVGACANHKGNLDTLDALVADGKISVEKIDRAREPDVKS